MVFACLSAPLKMNETGEISNGKTKKDFKFLESTLHKIIPATASMPTSKAYCACTSTKTKFPIIDFVPGKDNKLLMAIGGNGKGAKSADEMGYVLICFHC